MDLMDMGEVGSGWTGFPDDCFNQECHSEEPLFGFMELVCVTIIYVPLMVFGLLGNVLTILVVWLRPHMRSSTYLYLSSMAVSDLLILLLLPLDLYKLWRPRPWPLGDLACKLTMFLSECCTFSTILHITFLSLERYLAICWPIVAKTLVTRHRTKALIGCLWLGAAVSAAPVLLMVGVEGLEEGGVEAGWTDNRECRCTDYAVSSGLLSAMMVLSNLYFLVPFCILGLVYGLIGRTLWLRPRSNRRDQSHRHTVKMLGVIVLAFVLCWLPFHVGRTIFTLSLGSGASGQETHPDTSQPSNIGGSEGIDTHDVAEPVTRKLEMATSSDGGKTETRKDISTGKHSTIATHTAGRHTNTAQHSVTDRSMNKSEIDLYNQPPPRDATLKNVPSDFDTNAWTHTSKLGCTDAHTHVDIRNGKAVCVHTQTDRTQNHTGYALLPAVLRNDTHLNDTHADDDADMYFLYYLSQYFNLASSVLFYLSAAVNPLLYNLMSTRYRHTVHSLVHARSHTPVQRLRTLTGQHSTTTF